MACTVSALPPDQPYYIYPEYNCSTVDINGTCYYTCEYSVCRVQGHNCCAGVECSALLSWVW